MAIKLDLNAILAQVKPIERATRKAKEVTEGKNTVSSNASNTVDGNQFPTVVALHEYVFAKTGDKWADGHTGAQLIEGFAQNLMDTYFPGVKNPSTDKREVARTPFVRVNEKGEVMKAGAEMKPKSRAYTSKHYDYYLRMILKLGNFKNAEALGITEEEVAAAIAGYKAYTDKYPTRGSGKTVVEEPEA